MALSWLCLHGPRTRGHTWPWLWCHLSEALARSAPPLMGSPTSRACTEGGSDCPVLLQMAPSCKRSVTLVWLIHAQPPYKQNLVATDAAAATRFTLISVVTDCMSLPTHTVRVLH